MTNKKKARARALSKKTGMTHQAAVNALSPQSSIDHAPRELAIDFLPIGAMPIYTATTGRESLHFTENGCWERADLRTVLQLQEFHLNTDTLQKALSTLAFEGGVLLVAVKQIHDLYDGTVLIAGLMWLPERPRMSSDRILLSLRPKDNVYERLVGTCRTHLVYAERRASADIAFERLLPHIRQVEAHDVLVKRIWLNAKDHAPLIGHQHLDPVTSREDLKKGFQGTLLGVELWVNRHVPEGFCLVVPDEIEDDGLKGDFSRATFVKISDERTVSIPDITKRRYATRPSLSVQDIVERREITPHWSGDKQTLEELVPGPTKSALTVQSPTGKTYELDAPEELITQVSKAWQAMAKASKEANPEFDPRTLNAQTLKLQMDVGYGGNKSIRSLVEIPMGSGEGLIEQMLSAEPIEPKVSVVEKFADNGDRDWRRDRETEEREASKSQPTAMLGPYRLPTYIPFTSTASTREYVHFSYLLEDLLDYITVKPSRVESKDNPKTRQIGFVTRALDGYESVEWFIPLTYLMYYMKKEQPIEGFTDNVLRELIKSAAGRSALSAKLEEIANKRREVLTRLGTAEGTGSV